MADVEQASTGRHADSEWARAVAADAARHVDPEEDKHASAAYRRELVEVLLGDALAERCQVDLSLRSTEVPETTTSMLSYRCW